MLQLLWSLLLFYSDCHQILIRSSLYCSRPFPKISAQSVHYFLSNDAYKQTDKQTNATKNITSFAKEVTTCSILAFMGFLCEVHADHVNRQQLVLSKNRETRDQGDTRMNDKGKNPCILTQTPEGDQSGHLHHQADCSSYLWSDVWFASIE